MFRYVLGNEEDEEAGTTSVRKVCARKPYGRTIDGSQQACKVEILDKDVVLGLERCTLRSEMHAIPTPFDPAPVRFGSIQDAVPVIWDTHFALSGLLEDLRELEGRSESEALDSLWPQSKAPKVNGASRLMGTGKVVHFQKVGSGNGER